MLSQLLQDTKEVREESFLSQRGHPRSCLRATHLCFMNSFEQATISSKDASKKEGASFYLGKETIVA